MMRLGFFNRRGRAIAFVFAVFLLAKSGAAYFLDYNIGVRPTGLGGAFVAVADDANTMNWNPAGLAIADRYEVTTMFAGLFAGFEGRLYTGARDQLGYNYVAVMIPVDPTIGYFGASWAHLNSYFYFENTFNVGYARTLNLWNQSIHLGTTLKILNWSSEATDYAPAFSKTGFTADFGVLYPLPKKFVVGLNLENFIPTDVGVTIYEEVPRNFRIGLSWQQDLQPLNAVIENVLLSVEVVNRSYMQNKNTVRFGVESWFFDGLAAARTGVNSQEFTFSLSGCYIFEQLNNTQLQLDYSFSLPFYIQKTFGSHRLSLTASWEKLGSGKEKADRAEKELLKALADEDVENLAKMRDEQLKQSRAQDEAKVREMERKLRSEIIAAREALARIEDDIKSNALPAIKFKDRKSVLKGNIAKTLDQIGAVMKKHSLVKFRLFGHSGSLGKPAEDIRLSQARVRTVREYLVAKFGLNPKNIIMVGYGSTHPLVGNDTPAGREINQRIEVRALIPAGMVFAQPDLDMRKFEGEITEKEPIKPEDIVQYEELDELKEKLEVYEMQMDQDEVEELFKQQHQERR
ncbi:OmpA family protein [bacterium]|nr:OmpA family protein [bacterium]